MKRVELSPPWIRYYRELNALFEKDKEVRVAYYPKDSKLCYHPGNEDKFKEDRIEIVSMNYEKAEALKQLIPSEKKFGNVSIKIDIKYAETIKTSEELIKQAFKDNPAFKYTFCFDTGTNFITYVVFNKEVVQYWNDDMSDPHGVTSTLYADIAKRTLKKDEGYIFSTDSEKDIRWMEEYKATHATRDEIETWEMFNGEGSFEAGIIKDAEECDLP